MLKDASAGSIAWRARRAADSRGSGNHVKGEHDRSDRQHPSQESKSMRAMTYDLRTPSGVKSPTQGICFPRPSRNIQRGLDDANESRLPEFFRGSVRDSLLATCW